MSGKRITSGLHVILLAGLATITILSIPGCGSRQVPVRSAADRTDVVGVLKVEGATPFTRTMSIIEPAGNSLSLEAPRFEGEINLLSGHTLRIEGYSAPGNEGSGSFVVTGYEIIPGEGKSAVKGTIEEGEAGTVLLIGPDREFEISGPLTEALSGFKGFIVWVWGTGSTAPGAGGRTVMEVEGYQVLMSAR